jgi:hypothetical protein
LEEGESAPRLPAPPKWRAGTFTVPHEPPHHPQNHSTSTARSRALEKRTLAEFLKAQAKASVLALHGRARNWAKAANKATVPPRAQGPADLGSQTRPWESGGPPLPSRGRSPLFLLPCMPPGVNLRFVVVEFVRTALRRCWPRGQPKGATSPLLGPLRLSARACVHQGVSRLPVAKRRVA